MFWICLEFWIYQGSEYGFSSKYVRVLNIPFPKYKKNFFKENIRKFRFLKIWKAFFEKIKETFSKQGCFFLRKNINFLGEKFGGLRPKCVLGSCILSISKGFQELQQEIIGTIKVIYYVFILKSIHCFSLLNRQLIWLRLVYNSYLLHTICIFNR